MENEEIKKGYTNGDLNIVWKPEKCVHAGTCVKTLPQVYNPNEKPWIKPENASIEELKNQIDSCPSGALSYFMAGEEKAAAVNPSTTIKVLDNGPFNYNRSCRGAIWTRQPYGSKNGFDGFLQMWSFKKQTLLRWPTPRY